jgi:hypothetical protein
MKKRTISLTEFKQLTAHRLSLLLRGDVFGKEGFLQAGQRLVSKHKDEADRLWTVAYRSGFMAGRYADQIANNFAYWILDQEGLRA